MIVVGVLMAVAAVALVAGAHYYIWRRLVRDTTATGGTARRIGTVVVVALPLLAFAGVSVGRVEGAPFALKQILGWPAYMWLATLLYLLLTLLVGEIVRPVLRRVLERRAAAPGEAETAERTAPVEEPATVGAPAAPAATTPPGAPERPAADPSRRLFVSRVVGGAAAAATLATVGYGTANVLSGPTIKRVTVPLAKLPRSAHGYRIAVVSDIHLGPLLGRAHAQRIVDTINSTNPDLVAVVGDMVDGTVADLGPAAEPLAGLRAKHGSFFVTGNHEYFGDAREWIDRVRELGLHPLENAHVELAGFDLVGVNDLAGEDEGEGPDFAKALGGRDPARTSVLMAHQPVVIHDAVEHRIDLQLSGHTHGGQMWPVNYIAAAANPTLAGLERYGDTALYVTRGAGAWGPPVRVGAPADVTVVQLASRQA
ncbi:metallophosphoesterase [Streptomyces sp. NBC_01498]|uniref:metallophosphoesterase n=1 Tax=Streptomyces sp. NBC_01498 TaxID=2975870 RepID=UPI002E7BE5B6|nr:metallophosphoesterase [Streptomyces sp. NBC_01498]WTL25031.1 metallophosphoesterase [Streptomyces sp. NBC_01498]